MSAGALTRRAVTATELRGYLLRAGRPVAVEGLMRRERILRGTPAPTVRAALGDLVAAGEAELIDGGRHGQYVRAVTR